jgi:tRNA pseudouridine55 synthase
MGTPVTKPPRQITIFSINITDIALPFIGIEVECSAGTYIRVLASDIGKKLGFGAHLVSLERIECCGYDISGSYTPEDLKCMDDPCAVMVPMSCALPHMEKIIAGDSLREKIRFGRTINCDEIECGLSGNPVGDFIRITDSDDNLLAIVRRSQNIINYCCVFHC